MVSDEEARRRKEWLHAMAVKMDAQPRPLPQRPERPAVPFSIRSHDDDDDAQMLLSLHRAASSDPQIKKSFSVRQSLRLKSDPAEAPDPNMIFGVLEKHIADGGHPATTESLIAKLIEAGGDVNLSRITKKTLRIPGQPKYLPSERSRLLYEAIAREDNTLTSILIPYADQTALNECLAKAVKIGRMDYIRQLLSYGAELENSIEGEKALRQLCVQGRHSETVGLLVACYPNMTGAFAGACLIDAIDAGCLETVVVLVTSRSYFGDRYKAGLEKAIRSSRTDIIVAMANGIGLKHLGYDAACGVIFNISDTPSKDMLLMLEVLLCAGANGANVARGVYMAVQNENDELLDLLLRYKVPLHYESAAAVRHVLETKQFETAQKLLAPGVPLSPNHASQCLASIPDDAPSNIRSAFVGLLMSKGGSGDELAKCLVSAVHAGDIASIQLMFGFDPVAPLVDESRFRYTPAKASVDYNNGEALLAAIKTGKHDLIQAVLLGSPSETTLVSVIPRLISVLGHGKKLDAVALRSIYLVLKYSHTMHSTSSVLNAAVHSIPVDERDPKLMSLAAEKRPPFRYIRDPLALAVKNENAGLVERLLQAKTQSYTLASLSDAFMETVHVNEHLTRLQIMRMLVAQGVHKNGSAVFDVLMHILKSPKPIDLANIRLLMNDGQVNVNHKNGAAIVSAVQRNSRVLQLLLDKKTATNESIIQGLHEIVRLRPEKDTVQKLNYLLAYPDACSKDLATKLLQREIRTINSAPKNDRVLDCIPVLLKAGADLSEALCTATKVALDDVVQLLLDEKPSSKVIGQALSATIMIIFTEDRHRIARLLLQANPLDADKVAALRLALITPPRDSVLIAILSIKTDPGKGDKGLPTGTTSQDRDPARIPEVQFKVAVALTSDISPRSRALAARRALAAGPGPANAGSTTRSSPPTPATDLGTILPAEWPLIFDAGKGYVNSVRQLLEKLPTLTPAAATEAFRAAAKLTDIDAKLHILKMLVGHDVDKDVASHELVECAGLGRQGRSLAKILLALGANVNYNDGEGLVSATIAGNLNVVGTLLGMDLKSKEDLAKIAWPSQDVLVSTLEMAWLLPSDERYRVMTWLFGAGLAPGDAVDERLRQAVVEPAPDRRLIRLLFKRGASGASGGYKAIVLAATNDDAEIVDVCLEYTPVTRDNAGEVLETFIVHHTGDKASHKLTEGTLALLNLLFKLGADHADVSLLLKECIKHSGDNNLDLVKRFVTLLLRQGTGADQPGVLDAAVNAGNLPVLQIVLDANPNADTLNTAFPSIFTADPKLEEATAISMVRAFGNVRDHLQNSRLNPQYNHPVQVLYSALSAYPSSEVAQALIDTGFSADTILPSDISIDLVGTTETGLSILAWAIATTATHIPSQVISVLVQDPKFAGINTQTPRIRCSPLMLAVRSSRPRTVEVLLKAGADVLLKDQFGRPPLEVAVRLRKPCWEQLANMLLATGQHSDDGLLHDAALRLDPVLVQVFLQHGYDVDFESARHGGRTVLGELCLSGLSKYETEDEIDDGRRRRLVRVVNALLGHGASTHVLFEDKSPLVLALENKHAVVMTTVLLEAGLISEVNEAWNCYEGCSLTKYAALHLKTDDETRRRLLEVLKNAGGREFSSEV